MLNKIVFKNSTDYNTYTYLIPTKKPSINENIFSPKNSTFNNNNENILYYDIQSLYL